MQFDIPVVVQRNTGWDVENRNSKWATDIIRSCDACTSGKPSTD